MNILYGEVYMGDIGSIGTEIFVLYMYIDAFSVLYVPSYIDPYKKII